MKLFRLLLCFIILSMVSSLTRAQKGSVSNIFNERKAGKACRSADVYFNNFEYEKALAQYKKALIHSTFDSHASFRAGLCLYHLSQDSLALIEFERTRLLSDENGLLNFYLARCNHLIYNFEIAINYYNLEIDDAIVAGDTIFARKLRKYITECQSGIKLMLKKKDNLSVSSLPVTINSEWSDYGSFITGDGTLMFFTSGRQLKGKNEIDDNIFFSVKDVAGWEEATKIEFPVKSGRGYAVAGLSSVNGLKIYIWSDEYKGDLFFTSYDGMKWSKSSPLPGMINSPSEESSICFTASGDTAYFVSNRPVSTGGKDIFYSVRDGDHWLEPVNIGEIINTPFDEESVSIEHDTLYFSSQGHNSMGGYDIFMSIRNGSTWSKPENVGYPINSTYDDLFYNSVGGSIFFSSDRPGGLGKSDIFSVKKIMEEVH